MQPIVALNALRLAVLHRNVNDSADDCLLRAAIAYEEGRYEVAALLAIRSLSHSVGVFHFRYKTACEIVGLDPNTAHSYAA